MLNRVTLVGRITRDIELRRIEGSNTAVVNFTLALDRRFGNDETDFIPCTA
jgi:single-strand DNA-binding protein